MGSEMGIFAMLVIGLFLLLLFILWFILPFLIIGTNNRLNRIIALLHENNSLQEDIRVDIKRLAGESEKT